MSDEISSVVKMEMDGVTMAIKGTVKTAAFLVQLLKALAEHMRDARINRAGESRFADIQTLSEGDPPVIMIPEGSGKDFAAFCKKNKLHYHKLADLNASDHKVPFVIPRQELAMVDSFIKGALKENISKTEKTMSNLDNQIREKKEQLINATPEERKTLNRDIEHLQQAKDEVKKILDQNRENLDKENYTMTFTDYLATGQGTTVEKDPRGVVNGMAEGGQSVPIFTAKDIFEPIRSGALVPDSKVNFIVPETGAMVTRTFHQDENGLYYSKYTFQDKNGDALTGEKGKPIVFSDKDVTRDEWFNGSVENANFKDLLTKTGILEGTKCEYYSTQESLKEALNRYQAYNEQFQNIKNKDHKEQEPSFSSADVKEEVEYAASQNRKGEASAENAAHQLIFEVPADRIYEKDGKVTVMIGEESLLHFSNISMVRSDENGTTFTVGANDEVIFEDRSMDIPIPSFISAKEGLEKFTETGRASEKPEMESAATTKSR